jgi:hypothetical protein
MLVSCHVDVLCEESVYNFLGNSSSLCPIISQIFREFIEALDLFVGRYLVLIASGYIILKFVHFKIFPEFP